MAEEMSAARKFTSDAVPGARRPKAPTQGSAGTEAAGRRFAQGSAAARALANKAGRGR